MDYLNSTPRADGCFFCDAWQAADDDERLVVQRGMHAFVILNRYPYNNGHLMVVPATHTASLESLDAEIAAEVMRLVQHGLATLRRVYQPHGFNLGANIGQAAGAGVADHVHLHVLPRWSADTNFMTALSDTRVIPERLEDTWRRLKQAW